MAKSVRDEYWIDSSLIRLTPKCLAVRSGDIRVSTHAYHFLAGTDPAKSPLVLLHGSGGDEHDLMPLAEELAPGSPILGVRGTIAIDGGCAFFIACWTARLMRPTSPLGLRSWQNSSRPHGRPRPRQAAFRHRLLQWCHHGGDIADHPSQTADGCDPVPSSLTVQG